MTLTELDETPGGLGGGFTQAKLAPVVIMSTSQARHMLAPHWMMLAKSLPSLKPQFPAL